MRSGKGSGQNREISSCPDFLPRFVWRKKMAICRRLQFHGFKFQHFQPKNVKRFWTLLALLLVFAKPPKSNSWRAVPLHMPNVLGILGSAMNILGEFWSRCMMSPQKGNFSKSPYLIHFGEYSSPHFWNLYILYIYIINMIQWYNDTMII